MADAEHLGHFELTCAHYVYFLSKLAFLKHKLVSYIWLYIEQVGQFGEIKSPTFLKHGESVQGIDNMVKLALVFLTNDVHIIDNVNDCKP